MVLLALVVATFIMGAVIGWGWVLVVFILTPIVYFGIKKYQGGGF